MEVRRILYSQKPPGGGSVISLYDLVRGLDRSLFQPVVLFFGENEYREKFERLGVNVHVLNERPRKGVAANRSKSSFGMASFKRRFAGVFDFIAKDLPESLKVARIMKEENIDLVHQNTGFDRIVMIAAFIRRVPQVAHFRNFSKTVAQSVKLFSSRVEFIIYITEAIAEHYKSLGITNRRSMVIYDPIDVVQFSSAPDNCQYIRDEFCVAHSEFLVTNVGRITPWKGQDYFLLAIAEVIKIVPNVKVLVVGSPGPTDKDRRFFEELRNIVRKNNLGDNVYFTGLRGDVPSLMSASDIVVHSASEPEPFGRVIAEAMATGTPVIAMDEGGVSEIIQDQISGLLVSPKNVRLLKSAIEALLNDRKKAAEYGDRGKAVVVENFSLEKHVKAIQAIYLKIFMQSSRND